MAKIVFFGSSNFSSIILEKISKTKFCPFLVITTKESKIEEETNLPVEYLPLKIKRADLFIVASFGKILSKEMIDVPKYGSLNIHPSLLPKYRGPSPIQQTILNDDKKTGTTIILMDELIDHGPIVTQQEYEIKEKETFLSLEKKLAEVSVNLLIETLSNWLLGEIKTITQNDSQASFTKLFKKDDGKINWNKPANLIEREIRALNPWPGSFSFLENKRIKILEADYNNNNVSQIPGQIKDNFIIQCNPGSLMVKKIQLEGKKPTLIQDFLRGNKEIINKMLK